MACCMVYFGKDYEKFQYHFFEYGKCLKIKNN